MTVDILVLFVSVATLFCFMIPAFILRKSGLADDSFAKNLSLFVLYIAQVAMILHGFILPFSSEVFKGICLTFLLSLLSHIVFYLVAINLFKNTPEKRRRVLRFGMVFSNAGYMGIPVISDVFGDNFAIYATVYIVWFNVFAFSLGRLIYTDDKKYISIKKIILNPAVIPIIIGITCYLTGIGGIIYNLAQPSSNGAVSYAVKIFYNVLTVLKNTVAPVSMMVIGARLADIKFKGILQDRKMYPFLLMRLIVLPAIIWVIMKPLNMIGIIDKTIMTIVLILCSTPSAALTTIFAELYGGDSPYAGKLVAVSTVLSVVTIPLVALLMYI